MSATCGRWPGAGERGFVAGAVRERAPRAGSSVPLRVGHGQFLDYLAPDTLAPYRLTFYGHQRRVPWICWCSAGWLECVAVVDDVEESRLARRTICDCSAAAGACGVAEAGGCAGTENGASIRSAFRWTRRCGASGTAGTMQVLRVRFLRGW